MAVVGIGMVVGRHAVVDMGSLADGTVVALMHSGDGWSVMLGLTDSTVSHTVTGEPVPVTTDGCVWCGSHEALAREALALVLGCDTIREANRRSSEWWARVMCPLING